MFCAPFERFDEPDVQLLFEQLMTASGARPTGQLASSALSAVAAAESCRLAVCSNTCGEVPSTKRCPLDSAMCSVCAAGVRPSCRRLPAGVAEGAKEAGLLVDMDGSCALGFRISFSESTRQRLQSAAGTSSATARERDHFPRTLLLQSSTRQTQAHRREWRPPRRARRVRPT